MEKYFTHDLILHLIFFQTVLLVISLSNVWITRQSRRFGHIKEPLVVSMLVPARNEELNIARCVHSLLEQNYASFEVLVLDDHSVDSTWSIIEDIARTNPKLRVFKGKPVPDGMLGKNWACAQLADYAKGDLLLFTDADTQFSRNALNNLVQVLLNENADLLTGFPRQELMSWGEKLLVPFFSWAMLCFNSLWLAYRTKSPVLTSAVGQMMLFRRQAYFAIGGHQRIGDSIVDDIFLARNIKSGDFRWRVTHLADLIACRMYQSAREAYKGFAKNLFAIFNFRLIPYLFVFLWLGLMFLAPLIVLPLKIFGHAHLAHYSSLLLCIGLSILLWIIHYVNIKVNFTLALFYPVTILAILAAAYLSLYSTLSGNLSWKGRVISQIKWRWL